MRCLYLRRFVIRLKMARLPSATVNCPQYQSLPLFRRNVCVERSWTLSLQSRGVSGIDNVLGVNAIWKGDVLYLST